MGSGKYVIVMFILGSLRKRSLIVEGRISTPSFGTQGAPSFYFHNQYERILNGLQRFCKKVLKYGRSFFCKPKWIVSIPFDGIKVPKM